MSGEFAGFEFAGVEFALDGKIYVDIEAAGSFELTASGSAGTVVDVSGTAGMGVSATPDYTALAGAYGNAYLELDGLGDVPGIAEIAAGAAWQHTASGSLGYAIPVDGAASLEFTTFAEPLDDDVGVASWMWDSSGVGAAMVGANGSGFMTFQAAPEVAEIHASQGFASLMWTPVVKMTAVVGVFGTALPKWTAPGSAGVILDVVGVGTVKTIGIGQPGASIFGALPASRARFVVAPRQEAFVVPPDIDPMVVPAAIELNEV